MKLGGFVCDWFGMKWTGGFCMHDAKKLDVTVILINFFFATNANLVRVPICDFRMLPVAHRQKWETILRNAAIISNTSDFMIFDFVLWNSSRWFVFFWLFWFFDHVGFIVFLTHVHLNFLGLLIFNFTLFTTENSIMKGKNANISRPHLTLAKVG
jgi:hypothetical protein